MSGSAAREGRTAGLRRLAGPDDGRMYGMSDTGYQRTLQRLTDAEIEANEAATAVRRLCKEHTFAVVNSSRERNGAVTTCPRCFLGATT